MRLTMARVPGVALYLVCLSLYGFTMMTLNPRLEEPDGRAADESPWEATGVRSDDAPFGEETASRLWKERRRRRERSTFDKRISSVNDFFHRLKTPESFCRKLVDVGGSSCKTAVDNNKLFCLDQDVHIPPETCNVYSFGVGSDISFDYEMSKYGCEVHMFDPSVPSAFVNESIGRLGRIHFYGVGISDREQKKRFLWSHPISLRVTELNSTLDTFNNIRAQIRQQDLPIHYLKMDIEGTEWKVLPDMIASSAFKHVTQFALEIHAMSIINKTEEEAVVLLEEMWGVLGQVGGLGFRRVHYTPTLIRESMHWPRDGAAPIPTCGEVFFLKRH